jgi:hypothetical protein
MNTSNLNINTSNIDINTSNIDINISNLNINTSNIAFNADLFSENRRTYASNERNKLLVKTDKYLIPDFPSITTQQLIELKEFRQNLRDFFSRDDVVNYHYDTNENDFPNLPDTPSFIS